MTPKQENHAQVNSREEIRIDTTVDSPELNKQSTPQPGDQTPTSSGGDRNGWRAYFPAATKNLKRRDIEMKAQEIFDHMVNRLVGRLITIAFLIALTLLAAAAASAKTITVTSTGDTVVVDGTITLREAICAANTNAVCGDAPAGDPGLDVINFNIPASGVQTISLTAALPDITEPITIDGYSQKPCASNPAPCSQPNTLAVGSNAVLLIELNGAGAGAVNGLRLTGGNSTIRGLVINRFNFKAIFLATKGNNIIAGNYVGTNASGTAPLPSPNNNVGVYMDSANNTIGGLTPADRNVISGNALLGPGGSGVYLDKQSATGNKVIGNYIGTDASGTAAVGNQTTAIVINDCQANIVGGTTPAERNVISGNFGNGGTVSISGSASNNQIFGNYIGTKADGISALKNNGYAIGFSGQAKQNTLGGTQAGAGNVIAFNTGGGIFLNAPNINNAILGNSIYSNSSLGIELYNGVLGVTPNDNNAGDADTGANNLQNYPVITSALSSGGTTTIQGTLDSAFNTTFRLEFFSNNVCDGSGFGEGEKFLGFANVTTDASGKTGFNFTVPTASVVGGFFTATATDPNGNTSEFAACASGVVASPGTLQFSTNQISGSENAGSLNINVTRTNGSTGVVTVHYATVDGTAKAPADYAVTSGTLTFNSGEITKLLTIPIVDDNTPEGTEGFSFSLSNPTGGAVLGVSTIAFFTIVDNDLPKLSINNVSGSEGDQGSTKATFTVTLSDPVNGQVLVDWATVAGGTATAGSDYQSASGTLAFNSGQTVKQIDVMVNGDTQSEPDETFFVMLSGPQNATIAQAKGVGTIVNDDAAPAIAISDYSHAEGNSGTTSFSFDVTLSAASGQAVTVDYLTADVTAVAGSDYQAGSGTVTFAAGETSKQVMVLVNGDTQVEPNETFAVKLSNPVNASIGKGQGNGMIIDDDQPAAATIQFSQATYSVQEDLGFLTVTVVRSGDISAAVSVDYATTDDKAVQKNDYEMAAGTLNFAPGETSKTVAILINEDAYVEGDENFNVVLSNPNGAALGQQSTSSVIITDDALELPANPIDDAQTFVYMHYHDFLNREPDPAGLQFWTNQITSCGNDAQCLEAKRVNVSAAFFLSIEFQQTGYLRYLLQRESFGSMPQYSEYMRDLQELGRDVIVNSPGWEQKLKDNQQQFTDKWVNRPAFKSTYDGMSNVDYVNALYANAGILPVQAERQSLVNALDTASETRSAVLLEVAANASFMQKEQSGAFVLMQYFGYLRRDPNTAPDSDLSGYNFWLQKLNSFNGDFQQAEMVRAFIDSFEYRGRFAQ